MWMVVMTASLATSTEQPVVCLNGSWLWQAKEKNVWSWIRLDAIISSLRLHMPMWCCAATHAHAHVDYSSEWTVWTLCLHRNSYWNRLKCMFQCIESKSRLIVKIKRPFFSTHHIKYGFEAKNACAFLNNNTDIVLIFLSLEFSIKFGPSEHRKSH